MLTRIKEMYHQEALTLLYWLAYARSPPTLGGLVDAAITDPNMESFIDISERGGLRDALNILSGLVTIEENQVADTENYSRAGFVTTDTSAASDSPGASTVRSRHLTTGTRVRLAHFSVKEYLESPRIRHSHARQFHLESVTGHRILALSCITYLRYYSSSSEMKAAERAFQDFPLLRYAARSWAYHSALYANNDFVRETSFLQSETVKNDWLLVYDPDNPDEPPFQRSDDVGSSLYYASSLGLESVVCNLLRNGDDFNAKGGRFGNALQAASVGGFVGLVQLLVGQGADVNAIGGEYDTALHAASESGHVAVVNLLLEKGADVNALNRDDGTSLQAASRGGHLAVVQELLENNASVNTISGECGSSFLKKARIFLPREGNVAALS
jgi:ABC-type phosphate/phosphonate transport system substrate-binding protein